MCSPVTLECRTACHAEMLPFSLDPPSGALQIPLEGQKAGRNAEIALLDCALALPQLVDQRLALPPRAAGGGSHYEAGKSFVVYPQLHAAIDAMRAKVVSLPPVPETQKVKRFPEEVTEDVMVIAALLRDNPGFVPGNVVALIMQFMEPYGQVGVCGCVCVCVCVCEVRSVKH
jgi:hypothetical protein